MRVICLRLLTTYCHRGKILLEARESGVLPQLREEGRVSNDEAHVCIALYQNWSLFLQAEQWNYGLYRRCPRTPLDALLLIDNWVAAGSPRPLDIRSYVDKPVHFLMAIMSGLIDLFDLVVPVADIVC